MSVYIACVYWCNVGETVQFLTKREIETEREQYRIAAEKSLSICEDKNIRHMVYYRDEREEDGRIRKAFFYANLIGLTDEQYDKRTRGLPNGLVCAVHRM